MHGTHEFIVIHDLLHGHWSPVLNFFSNEDRKASYFKMKSISFGFIRDLRDWEMRFDYTGNRELSYDGTRYIWDNTYSISMGLKDVSSVNLHTVIRD